MIFKKILFYSISICMFISCRVTKDRISGKYVDTTYNDSLKLNKDGSYTYLETLKSGALGRTDGEWTLDHKQVTFTKDKPAFIGYRMEVKRNSDATEGFLKFVLGDTEKALTIRQVKISDQDKITDGKNLIQTINTVKIPGKFDFMVINTDHFANILIKDSLQPTAEYIVRVFPIERLYELDHLPFKIRGKKLKSAQQTMYDDRVIKFKRVRK